MSNQKKLFYDIFTGFMILMLLLVVFFSILDNSNMNIKIGMILFWGIVLLDFLYSVAIIVLALDVLEGTPEKVMVIGGSVFLPFITPVCFYLFVIRKLIK